jgi:hypothetical protein
MCAAQFHGERSSSFRLVVERAGPEPDPAGCRDHATSDTLRGRREPEHRRYAASALAMPRRNRRSPPSSARGHLRLSRFGRESACPQISDMSGRMCPTADVKVLQLALRVGNHASQQPEARPPSRSVEPKKGLVLFPQAAGLACPQLCRRWLTAATAGRGYAADLFLEAISLKHCPKARAWRSGTHLPA